VPVNNTGRAKQSSPLGDSLKSLANQLLSPHYFDKDSDEDTSDSMVNEDVRTPPKLKSQIKQKQNNQNVKLPPKTTAVPVHAHNSDDTEEETNHKGIAVPVIIEDDDDVEETIEKLSHGEPTGTVTATNQKKKPYYETTSPDGVSTWVLLSDSSSTTPSHLPNKLKNNKTPAAGNQKTSHTTPTVKLVQTASSSGATRHTSEELIEPYHHQGGGFGTMSPISPLTSTRKPVRIGSLSSQPLGEISSRPWYYNETMLKLAQNRKPNPTHITTSKTKVVPTTPIPSSTKRRPDNQQNNNQKTQLRGTTASPTAATTDRRKVTEEPLRSSPTFSTTEYQTASSEGNNNVEEISSTDATVETTTKRPSRRPSGENKKRKKNKNRRRRPSNRPEVTEDPESKTDDANATSTNNKVATKERPLSTRIYNYLAREVMPSVGVGLIGLVVTAGLAGLIMYPFGGGLVSRRTYEEAPYHHINPSMYYHHSEYGDDIDNSKSEEEVFGKLLEGMNDKGEFSYGGIGEETTGYAGVPGMSTDQDSRYKTGDGKTYSPPGDVMHGSHQGVRYGGGRIEDVSRHDTRIRYDSARQGATSYAGTGDNKVSHPYTHGNQQNYGSVLHIDNSQGTYRYGEMATRNGEIGDLEREQQQPLYSGSVNVAKKQYTVGGVRVDSSPHHHTDTEITAYGGSYYTPSYVESQPYTRNVYGTLTAVAGQTYGNVQVDSKSGSHHSGSTEGTSETKQKAVSISESKSAGNQEYRGGVSESRQRYRDVTGTQPRSGGTLITVSVTRQPRPQGKEGETETKQARDEESSSQRTHEEHRNQKIDDVSSRSHDSDTEYGDSLHISSRISPELQKRGSLTSGFVEHGPRNLRLKRNVNASTELKIPNGDTRDNEIDSNNSKENVKRNQNEHVSQYAGSVQLISGNVVTSSSDKKVSGDNAKEKGESQMMETGTSTINEEATTGPTEDTKYADFGTTLSTESITLEDKRPTTTGFIDDDADGEDTDTEQEDEGEEDEEEEYDTTVSPEITTSSGETSTKHAGIETETKVPETQFSLIGLFRSLARYKLRMGLSLLKSTSQALTNYIERVQKRMDKDHNGYNG